MKVLVFPRHDDRWCWALCGVDGSPIAVSSRAFSTYAQAMTDGQAAIGGMSNAAIAEDAGYIPIPGPEHLVRSVLRR